MNIKIKITLYYYNLMSIINQKKIIFLKTKDEDELSLNEALIFLFLKKRRDYFLLYS